MQTIAVKPDDGRAVSPGGMGVVFEAFIELTEAGDPCRRQELAAKYGVTHSSDRVPELITRHNLKLLGQQDRQ